MQALRIAIYAAIGLAALMSAIFKKLTLAAAFVGFGVAVLTYTGGGSISLLQLALFFVLGIAATKIGYAKKVAMNEAETNAGRDAYQVLANGGIAALLGIACLLFPKSQELCKLMIAGSLAAATADTLSSEIGMVYGKRFFNIITFKPDNCGFDGVVSFEGLLAGFIGALAIGFTVWFDAYITTQVTAIVIAGFTGTIIDSILGATIERKSLAGNNTVNALNTLSGALMAGLLILIF